MANGDKCTKMSRVSCVFIQCDCNNFVGPSDRVTTSCNLRRKRFRRVAFETLQKQNENKIFPGMFLKYFIYISYERFGWPQFRAVRNVSVRFLAQWVYIKYKTFYASPSLPLSLEGTVHIEGNITHFVAEDLEYKIKLSSPVAKKGDTPPLPGNSRSCTPSSLYRQLLSPQVGQLDVGLLSDLECEAQKMATSIDNLTENLCGILHSISSITADNVDVYKNAVSKMSDAMDSNIKSMYTMMAKTEEVTQAMRIVQSQASRIKEIKRLVDLFESYI